MRVEVVIAWADRQLSFPVELPASARAWDAVKASGVVAVASDLDPSRTPIGVFSRLVTPDTLLQDGDRVEIYRPLPADPKATRRARVARARRKARGRAP